MCCTPCTIPNTTEYLNYGTNLMGRKLTRDGKVNLIFTHNKLKNYICVCSIALYTRVALTRLLGIVLHIDVLYTLGMG